MNKVFRLVALVLLILVSSNVFAEDCVDKVDISPKSVEINQFEGRNVVLFIDNLSDERFFIEDLKAFHYTRELSIEVKDFSETVDLDGGFIILKTTALNVEPGEHPVFIQARGFFEKGISCDYGDFKGRKVVFNVIERNLNEEENCGNFSIDAPEEVLSNSGGFVIPVTLKNYNDHALKLTASGNNIAIDKRFYYFIAQGEKKLAIKVETNKETSLLLLKAGVPGCKNQEKHVKLTRLEEGIDASTKAQNNIFNPAGFIGLFGEGVSGVFLFLLFVAIIIMLILVILNERKLLEKEKKFKENLQQ